MRNWHIILMFVFLFVTSAQTQAAQRKIVIVKEWEQDQINPVFDQVYNIIIKEFTLNDSFIVMDQNELQAKSSLVLTSIFPDTFEPLHLSELNQTLHLDIVMLLSQQQGNMYINTLEFPSGVTIDKYVIDKSELDATKPERLVQFYLGGLIEQLKNKFTIYGYPFQTNEYGIIIITNEMERDFIRANLYSLQKYYSQVLPAQSKPLRIKMIKTLDCELASQMCTLTGAQFAMSFAPDPVGLMDYRLTLIFPYMENNKPAIHVEYPCLTANEQLVCYEFAGENPSMEHLGEMLFNKNIDYKQIEIMPIFLRKLALLHHEWAAQKSETSSGSEKINNYYILLYNQLPANSLASAWVGLNYAGFYMQTGQYIMAEPLFNKVNNIFSSNSDYQGMILSLLGTAQTATMLKNYTVAKRAYENVLKVYNIKDDSITVAAVNYNLGLIAELNQSPKLAINYYESSAYLYNTVNEKYTAMQIYQKIAKLLAETGELEKAVDYNTLYLARAEELFSEPDIAQAQFALGQAGFKGNNYSEAQQYLLNAKNYYEMLGDQHDELVVIDLKLGIIHFKNHEYSEAQTLLYATLEKSEKLTAVEDFYDLYRYLGDLEAVNQNWIDAQKCYDVGLERATLAKAQPKIAEFVYRKGLAHLKEGKVEAGYKEVKKGIDLSNGAVHGGRKMANEFLKKLENAIKK